MRGQKRPPLEAANAVGLALVKGVPQASKETGIPQRTIRQWRSSPEFAELRLSAREKVAETMWVAIQDGLDEVHAGLTDPNEPLKAKADALFGLMQQHALMTGGATARTENRDLGEHFDDHELDLLREAIAGQSAAEAAVADSGAGQPAPTDG